MPQFSSTDDISIKSVTTCKRKAFRITESRYTNDVLVDETVHELLGVILAMKRGDEIVKQREWKVHKQR